MFRRFVAALAGLVSISTFASVDANKASRAELESVTGVGPSIAGKIIDERKRGAFRNWDELMERVGGIGESNAARLSAEGLTVGGAIYKGAGARKADKPAAAARAPAAAEASKTAPNKEIGTAKSTAEVEKNAKAEAKDKKAAADGKLKSTDTAASAAKR